MVLGILEEVKKNLLTVRQLINFIKKEINFDKKDNHKETKRFS